MSDFTDEDVQRGVRAANQWDVPDRIEDEIHAALAAVLPEYAKRVRVDALREAADAIATEPWVKEWLRARADTEEGK